MECNCFVLKDSEDQRITMPSVLAWLFVVRDVCGEKNRSIRPLGTVMLSVLFME